MHMTGLAFVYVVLPVIMALFLLAPVAWRPGVLLAVSAGYFFLSSPEYLILMISCAAIDWVALLMMERCDDNPKARLICVILSAAKNTGLILWYGGLRPDGSLLGMPPGLLVYALSSMSFILETFRREVPYERSPVSFALYCCYFPRLTAGPLQPYADFAPQMRSLRPALSQAGQGMGLFIGGAVKAGVLGSSLQTLYNSLCAIPQAEISVLSVWCTLFVLALTVYYRLSGFADAAAGLSAMMGISLPQNFRYPYQSRSITDFFERFNISAGLFLKRSVYRPMRRDNDRLSDFFALLTAGSLMGLWFGPRANYLAWGAYLALVVFMEKYVYRGLLARIPVLFRRGYALCVILCSFAIFGADSASSVAAVTIARMFGFGSLPLFNDRLGYLLYSNWLLLTLSALLSTSAVSRTLSFVRRHLAALSTVLTIIIDVSLLIVFTVFSL